MLSGKISIKTILAILVIILGIALFLSIRSCDRQSVMARRYKQSFFAANDSIKTYVSKSGELVSQVQAIILDRDGLKRILNDTSKYYTSKYSFLRHEKDDNHEKMNNIILALNAHISAQNDLIGYLSNNVIIGNDTVKVYRFSDGYFDGTFMIGDTSRLTYRYSDRFILLKKRIRKVRSNGKPYFWLWRWVIGKHDVYEAKVTNSLSSVDSLVVIEVE